ncbi:MAG: hypothetical protein ACLUE7_07155 [Lachnospirales bacterium]
MPFINVKTNVKISKENEVAIKTMLGEAIALIPGKSENHLCSLWKKAECGSEEQTSLVLW